MTTDTLHRYNKIQELHKKTYIYSKDTHLNPTLGPQGTMITIFTFMRYNDYDTPYFSSQTQTRLHLCDTTTTTPHTFHHKHTYIYIYTIQQLRHPIPFITNHTYIYNKYDTPAWTRQH